MNCYGEILTIPTQNIQIIIVDIVVFSCFWPGTYEMEDWDFESYNCY